MGFHQISFNVHVYYFPTVTPEDYEPPGFKAADSDNFVFEEEPMTIKVGDVETVCTINPVISSEGKSSLFIIL